MSTFEMQTHESQEVECEEIQLDPSKLFSPMSNAVQPISDQSN